MNGAKIPGYQSITICIIKYIANVIPEIFFERRGVGSGGGGWSEGRIFRDNDYKVYIANFTLPIFMCKLEDVV